MPSPYNYIKLEDALVKCQLYKQNAFLVHVIGMLQRQNALRKLVINLQLKCVINYLIILNVLGRIIHVKHSQNVQIMHIVMDSNVLE